MDIIQYKRNMLILDRETHKNEITKRLQYLTGYIQDFQKDIKNDKINNFCMTSIQNEMTCIEDCYNNLCCIEKQILLLNEINKEN